MSEVNDIHSKYFIKDVIDNPVITYPDTVTIAALQFFASVGVPPKEARRRCVLRMDNVRLQKHQRHGL